MECYSKQLLILDYEALKEEPLIELDTIGLKGSPTNIFKSFTPPQKGVGIMLQGSDKEKVDDLVARLSNRHII
jgi:electron transfer flavoprotein beta subunit